MTDPLWVLASRDPHGFTLFARTMLGRHIELSPWQEAILQTVYCGKTYHVGAVVKRAAPAAPPPIEEVTLHLGPQEASVLAQLVHTGVWPVPVEPNAPCKPGCYLNAIAMALRSAGVQATYDV